MDPTKRNLGTSKGKSGMKKAHVQHIILPNIQAMMTGVWRILRAHDLVTLEYTDMQRESATIPVKRWSEIHGNVFSIVREVQETARGVVAK
jgi:hypothetical protein